MRRRERLLLGLRLDEPRAARRAGAGARPRRARAGSSGSGWPPAAPSEAGDETLALTERGRFLGGGVTAELLA